MSKSDEEQRRATTVWEAIRFGPDGLIPAIAQQFDSGEILMMAWMNRDALAETLSTGHACYWSRSRQRLWRKGERSGQTQDVKAVYVDCDGDTLLIQVDQTGVSCHTGHRTCFYRQVDPNGSLTEVIAPERSEEDLYGTL